VGQDIDAMVDEVLDDLNSEAGRRTPWGQRLTQAQGNVVAARVALDQAVAGVDTAANIDNAIQFLRQAVRHQRGLAGSASQAIAAIRRRDLASAVNIVIEMYREVGGGSA
jgi:hypothetical protein